MIAALLILGAMTAAWTLYPLLDKRHGRVLGAARGTRDWRDVERTVVLAALERLEAMHAADQIETDECARRQQVLERRLAALQRIAPGQCGAVEDVVAEQVAGLREAVDQGELA